MASERGRLRCGLRTSPAVKVTLFQASAENKRADLRHGYDGDGGDQRSGSGDADGNFVQRAESGVEPEVGAEIGAERLRRAADPDAEDDERRAARQPWRW